MKCYNVGGADRIARAIVGAGIIGAGFYFQSWLGLIGVVPLFTAAAGFCPAYLPFRATTCPVSAKQG
jgi:hypothetical protein